MARIQNVEKAQYINSNIAIYSQNKVGQYSKFLDKNPIFVTYYHMCSNLTRSDVGTGGIESELGPRSPIRFNKILTFPLYNIPEIKPEVVYDETGYDIDLDLSDIVVLPNTIKPIPGDYFILEFPGIKEYLFRVNNFRYNTIQSNDFYSLDCDIKDIGQNIEEKRMTGQIVDEYQTVFDNIGTQDRCFVKTTDISYLNSIVNLYYKLRDYYKDAFYNQDANVFTMLIGNDETGYPLWINDPYLGNFINKSHLYYDENVEETIILSLEDLFPRDFNMNYSKTLYDAVTKKSLELLCKYQYSYYTYLTKRFSTFSYCGMRGSSVNLIMSKNIILGNTTQEEVDQEINGIPVDNNVLNDTSATINIPWYSILNLPKWIPTWTAKGQYVDFKFLESILNGELNTNDYFELIIFNYLHNIPMEYDRKNIIDEIDEDLRNYYYLPLIIYIFGQQYQAYFKKENTFEL